MMGKTVFRWRDEHQQPKWGHIVGDNVAVILLILTITLTTLPPIYALTALAPPLITLAILANKEPIKLALTGFLALTLTAWNSTLIPYHQPPYLAPTIMSQSIITLTITLTLATWTTTKYGKGKPWVTLLAISATQTTTILILITNKISPTLTLLATIATTIAVTLLRIRYPKTKDKPNLTLLPPNITKKLPQNNKTKNYVHTQTLTPFTITLNRTGQVGLIFYTTTPLLKNTVKRNLLKPWQKTPILQPINTTTITKALTTTQKLNKNYNITTIIITNPPTPRNYPKTPQTIQAQTSLNKKLGHIHIIPNNHNLTQNINQTLKSNQPNTKTQIQNLKKHVNKHALTENKTTTKPKPKPNPNTQADRNKT